MTGKIASGITDLINDDYDQGGHARDAERAKDECTTPHAVAIPHH
jgi:hypothetical protein